MVSMTFNTTEETWGAGPPCMRVSGNFENLRSVWHWMFVIDCVGLYHSFTDYVRVMNSIATPM